MPGAKEAASFSFTLALQEQFGEHFELVNRELLGFSGLPYGEAQQAAMQKYAGKTLTVRDMCHIINHGAGVTRSAESQIPTELELPLDFPK
jgi:hypothetical protein